MLLTTTSRSISDIADDCGFENLSYFYRRFGREFGESPMKHRMQARRRTAG
jgi:AraC-like DNA-binding protein